MERPRAEEDPFHRAGRDREDNRKNYLLSREQSYRTVDTRGSADNCVIDWRGRFNYSLVILLEFWQLLSRVGWSWLLCRLRLHDPLSRLYWERLCTAAAPMLKIMGT